MLVRIVQSVEYYVVIVTMWIRVPLRTRPVTQAVECMFDKHEVNGSSPFRSKFYLLCLHVGIVDKKDSKSFALGCVGASPSAGIFNK